MQSQVADHEDDLENVFEHLQKHDAALEKIVETLSNHLEAIRS